MRAFEKLAILALVVLLAAMTGCSNRAVLEQSASNREFMVAVARAIDDVYQSRRQEIPEDAASFSEFSAKAHASVESAASRLDRYLAEPSSCQEPAVERLTYALTCFRGALAALDRGFLYPSDAARADVRVGFKEGRAALMDAVMLMRPTSPPGIGGRYDPTAFVLTDEDAAAAVELVSSLSDRRLGELADEGTELEVSTLPSEVLSLTMLTAAIKVRLQEEA